LPLVSAAAPAPLAPLPARDPLFILLPEQAANKTAAHTATQHLFMTRAPGNGISVKVPRWSLKRFT
jgi:hypothetical protein